MRCAVLSNYNFNVSAAPNQILKTMYTVTIKETGLKETKTESFTHYEQAAEAFKNYCISYMQNLIFSASNVKITVSLYNEKYCFLTNTFQRK